MQVSASEQTHNSFPILRVLPELMGDHFDGRVVFISLFDVVEGDKEEIKAAYRENREVFSERLRDYLDENYPAMSVRMVIVGRHFLQLVKFIKVYKLYL